MEGKRSLGSYLGAAIDIQGSKVPHFTFLLDIVSRKIASWNHTWLSQPTKLIIINSILVATIMHHLSIFQIPTTITNKLDAMIAGFFLEKQLSNWGTLEAKGDITTPAW